MHDHEVDIDDALVRRLLTTQFPEWSDLTLRRVASSGTDNAIYRLGDEMSVRLPRIESATGQADMEMQWLPMLAPRLPLPIPTPLALGQPAHGYPFTWSVYRWLPGETANLGGIRDERAAATMLGEFVTALHGIDTVDGSKPPGFGRGGSLARRDRSVRAAMAELDGYVDTAAATVAWEAAINADEWTGAPVWIHSDLHAGNLLMRDGRLSAVIDFAGLDVGDPAVDAMPAWTFLSAASRDAFWAVHPVDDATWARARGWALCLGLVALPYYRESNPEFFAIAQHTVDEILAEPSP